MTGFGQYSLQDTLTSHLIAIGKSKVRALMIAEFVSSSMALTSAAHARLIRPSRWKTFLKTPGAISRPKLSTSEPRVMETAVTADLAREATDLLKRLQNAVRLDDERFVRANSIAYVIADVPLPSAYATGDKAKRPDLEYIAAESSLLINFSAEAKVVETSAEIGAALLGSEGLGCYLRAVDPYPHNGVIGLFAYTLRTIADPAPESLLKQFKAGKRAANGFTDAALHDYPLRWKEKVTAVKLVTSRHALHGCVCVATRWELPSIRCAVTRS